MVVLELLLTLLKKLEYIVDYREDVIKGRLVRFKCFCCLSDLIKEVMVLLKKLAYLPPNLEVIKLYFFNFGLVIHSNLFNLRLIIRALNKPAVHSMSNLRFKSS